MLILECLATTLALVASGLGLWRWRQGHPLSPRASAILVAGLGIFAVGRLLTPWLALRAGMETEPVALMSLIALVAGTMGWFTLHKSPASLMVGLLALMVAMGFAAGLVLPRGGLGSTNPELAVWFYPHIVAASLAMGSSVVSMVVAVLYLAQDHALRTGSLRVAQRLPRLTMLGASLDRAIELSALFYTLTVVLGSTLAAYLWHSSPQADPFTVAAMLGALAQVSLFVARGRLGWANRRLALATLGMLTFWAAVTVMAGRVFASAHVLLN